MLDNTREAMAIAADRRRADLDGDRLLELGLVRLIEIVGEAAAKVTDDFRSDHPQIPWPQIVAMRNRLVHGYDEIDLDVLWDTIRDDLPSLATELAKLLES
ncbi:MAG TPA: HepT-like ribonuclease domain-containing protein [Polyangia bacterium]|nr:HepT-like ribonuclease domain-containing protein [Polyangia bacterium]